jgi:hypothetical protein
VSRVRGGRTVLARRGAGPALPLGVAVIAGDPGSAHGQREEDEEGPHRQARAAPVEPSRQEAGGQQGEGYGGRREEIPVAAPAQRSLEEQGEDEEREGRDPQQQGGPVAARGRLLAEALQQDDHGARREREQVVLRDVPEVLCAEDVGGIHEHTAGPAKAIRAHLEGRRAEAPAEGVERHEVQESRRHGQGKAPEVARRGRLRAEERQGEKGRDQERGQGVHRHGECGQEARSHERALPLDSCQRLVEEEQHGERDEGVVLHVAEEELGDPGAERKGEDDEA